MQHVIVGTAGHVDHGKTLLVKALTGVDTDRLKEEKERGISIELGFAPLKLPDGRQLGLVDVPGHERFIRQMLAGVAGIDVVLLVVAADEGVMPQTREHLAIIDLLQIKRGILVLTKIDLVEPAWLDLVEEEVRELVRGTSLEEAPLVRVSAVTGEGLKELKEILARITLEIPPRPASGRVRLPIDRVFSLPGFGTIVTGTLWSGSIDTGMEVEILPEGRRGRARGLQVHGHPVSQAQAGQRVAVNLAGVEVQDIRRGSVLVEPGLWQPAVRIDANIKLLPGAKLKNRERVRFYLATKEAFGRVVLLDREELEGGMEALAQLVLEEPVVAAPRDRFILRTYSPLVTIGGGEVIAVNTPRYRRYDRQVLETLIKRLKGSLPEIFLDIIRGSKEGLELKKASAQAGLTLEEAQDVLKAEASQGKLVVLPAAEGEQYVITSEGLERFWERTYPLLKDFHRRYPLRVGLPKEELRSRIFSRLDWRTFQGILERWSGEGKINLVGNSVALATYKVELDERQKRIAQVLIERYRAGWFQPPLPEEAGQGLDLAPEELEELLHFLVRQGHLVKVGDELYFHKEAVTAAQEEIRRLGREGPFTLGAVRDRLGSSRKYVLPLLEYLDQIKFTRRIGDKRTIVEVRAGGE
ncbi:selenocysteine-specific translation elongation factor SelB [Thermanaeromonas toyohensis ToBE]|uniref:Selenocysteine-specific elongation factor n=1 Tax=Thermanaeromonas toyohensis ToBE TaxID=698762 RepID=A0A1W1W3W5_9FIRM|nr:selenocysteine-specific translation elongation factor [Thermanaeromonas toyohensis]SMC00150.1 selenocysteine-specific translation elongation factor SelB [Thermanaeromonas toyohensis ToBE]